jgi:tetratricopeptide (TPR) repeat protein/tRNA A-37 threonylcarbamoyl transferase component Bud32
VSSPQNREERLLAAGLEMPADKRPAWLDAVCAGDAALRQRLETLLAARQKADELPPSDAPPVVATIKLHLPEAEDEAIGQTIGRYKVLEKVGEGGCGMVYVAQQTEPVRRRVALKVIKLGMDTKQVVARFEAERQALAMMDHPNIAKVLDAGSTDTGRPYFVMELVRGIKITDYCDQGNLTTKDRLDLFIKVCQAIQHAHQKGIIHRDIKPSNILVTLQDGVAVPKVIDFGIAKATRGRLTDATVYTQLLQFIGTPAYMSPEQMEMSGLDVDTRSDIYSLGVLLYELLVGATPFDAHLLAAAGIDAMRQTIREIEPIPPSTRFTTLKRDDMTTTAKRRSTPAARLIQMLKGDLDWIVMKCLEKDRKRRYETANGLAMDIHRHLAGEPVEAAPPSAAYRFEKFLHRHRGQVIAGGVVASALVLGIIGTIWQATVASAQRDKARSEAARALAAESKAHQRADELQKVADFQGEMLAQVDPAAAGVRLAQDVRARFDAALAKDALPDKDREAQVELFAGQWSRVNATDTALELIDNTILKPAVAAIEKQFAGQPAIAASLRHVLAERYHNLGLDNAALALEQQALKERRRVLGAEHPDTLLSMGNVGAYLSALGKMDEAQTYYREALEKSRRLLGDDNPQTLNCIANMGNLLVEKGQLTEAEPLLREALQGRRRLLGNEHADTLESIRDWATLLKAQGKLAEAETNYSEVLSKRRRVLGEDNPKTLTSINDLANLLQNQGKLDEATKYFREVTEKRRRILGEAHPATLSSMQDLGSLLDQSGHPAEAESLLREALAKKQQLLGPDHPSTLVSLGNLAVFLIGQDKLTEAEPLCRETLERRKRVMGVNHSETLVANNVMGLVLIRQGKLAEGEPYWREALATAQRLLGPAHPETLVYMHNLAGLALDQKKPAEAEQLFREVIQTGGPALGAGHPTVLSATRRLGGVLLEEKKYPETVELLSTAEPLARKAYTGANGRLLAALLKNLGAARAQLKQFPAAETNLLEAHALFIKTRGESHADTRACAEVLVSFYSLWDKADPGKGYDARSTEWKAKLEAMAKPATEKKI